MPRTRVGEKGDKPIFRWRHSNHGNCTKSTKEQENATPHVLESPAEKIAAIVTKTDQKMPKDRTILSSSSQKARTRTCKEKDE